MKYKILTERDKKIREIFKKLVARAYANSGPLSSKVMGWSPTRGYKAGFRPGDLINKLTDEERKIISDMKAEDIENIERGILQLICFEQQHCKSRKA